MQQKDIKFYIAGSLLVIVILFLSIELTTRTVSFFSGNGFLLQLHELDPHDKSLENLYKWHPFTGFVLYPNQSFLGGHPSSKDRARIFSDKHGFLNINNTLKYEKEENEIRIATIGASTTANMHLSYEQNWPGRLGLLLQKEIPNKKITIINAAVPGFDTAQSIGNLALRVMPFKPDIVIIYHAYNDLKAINPDKEFHTDYSHIHTTPYGFHEKPPFYILLLNRSMAYVRIRNKYRDMKKEISEWENYTDTSKLHEVPSFAARTFTDHLHSLIGIAKSGGAKVVVSSFATLHNPNLHYGDKKSVINFSHMKLKELFSLKHFIPGLSIAGMFAGIKTYNGILKNTAETESIGWVDNANLIPHEDKYFVDRVHFSQEGAALMAENFFPVVLQLMQENDV